LLRHCLFPCSAITGSPAERVKKLVYTYFSWSRVLVAVIH
jgi:hypothetical protein